MKKKQYMIIKNYVFFCKKEFCVDKNDKKEYKLKCKVRDHCHFTGKYCCAAHSECNLHY